MLGEQLLVGGDDRLAGPQRVEHVVAGRVGAADQLDDQVGALEDLAEVALAAGEHAGELRPPPGRRLDRVGALGEQLGEGGADRAAPEQPDADGFEPSLRHRARSGPRRSRAGPRPAPRRRGRRRPAAAARRCSCSPSRGRRRRSPG